MKHISKTLLLCGLLTVLGLTSCNDGPGKDIPSNVTYEIVTVETMTDKGASFTFRRDGDSPIITLTTDVNLTKYNEGINKEEQWVIRVGQRILLCYAPADNQTYTSGPIDFYGFRILDGTQFEIGSKSQYQSFMTDPIRIQMLWRTGTYINMQIQCFYNQHPKRYVLVADEATIDDEYPQLYVIVDSDKPGNDTLKIAYASFDIASVWNKPTCKGVKINYYTTVPGMPNYTIFTKTSTEQVTPTI